MFNKYPMNNKWIVCSTSNMSRNDLFFRATFQGRWYSSHFTDEEIEPRVNELKTEDA